MLERRVSQLENQLAESRSAFTEATQSCKTIKETLEHELELASQKLVDEQATTERLQTQLAAVEQELKDLKPTKGQFCCRLISYFFLPISDIRSILRRSPLSVRVLHTRL